MDLRSIVLGVDSPACTVTDEFTCFSKTGSKFYVSGNRTNENYEEFCKEVEEKHSKDSINWSYSKSYDLGTPEEHDYVVSLGNGVSAFDKDQCIESMKKLINSCDTSDNPMNWKGGGRYIRGSGDYKYELNPRRSNRPWPWPKNPIRLRVLASPPGIMAERLFGLTWTVAMDSVRRFGNSSTLTTRLIMMGTNGTLPSVRQSGFARAVGTTTRLSKPQEDGRMGVRAMIRSFLRVIWFVRR
jgi:hypothetical protein